MTEPSPENKEVRKDEIIKGDDLPSKESIESLQGPIATWLKEKGLETESMNNDHIGIEIISLKPKNLLSAVIALKEYGFDYLQCQGGYDEGAGRNLVCFYHLITMNDFIDNQIESEQSIKIKEVRLKVFLDRNGDLKVPSLYKIFKGADWQERETYDMFGINFEGHPHPKRLLMPEDWKGWPLRKDYVQPDFYEMQDAY